jgi:hypothetical protein
MDTLAEPRNPAPALQAIWITVLRTAYSDAVSYFDYYHQTKTHIGSEEQMPLRKTWVYCWCGIIRCLLDIDCRSCGTFQSYGT